MKQEWRYKNYYSLIGKIRDMFDVIAGTSTGGILAIGIENGIKLSELEKMYTSLASEIFEKDFMARWAPGIKILNGPTYSSEKLEQLLRKYLGDKKINQLNQNALLLVVSHCATTNLPYIFSNKVKTLVINRI